MRATPRRGRITGLIAPLPLRPRTFVVAALFLLALIAGSCRPRPSAPRNLVLITIDTVRADHVGVYGDQAAETPAIDSLARSGIRFENAVSPVPLTLPSHSTILSGLLPIHHGVRNNGGTSFPQGRATLATVLKAAGYRTGAFVGSFVLDHRFGLNRGFDIYDDEIERDPDSSGNLEAERPAGEVVDRALRWLSEADGRPFFIWIHLYDAHAPYAPPEPYRSRYAGQLYDGEVAYVDAQIGRVMEQLRRSGRSDATVVAIAADHGEALGEHGELTHGLLLYEPTLRVPLVVAGPSLPVAVLRNPVSLTDLAPTLAGILGHPLTGVDGRDLSAQMTAGTEPPVTELYAETEYPTNFGWSGLSAMRRGDIKYIESPHPELFDLRADPKETTNRRDSERRAARELSLHLASLRAGAVTKRPVVMDAETAAKLASLGYVAPSGVSPGTQARDPKEMAGLFRKFETATWAISGHRLDEAVSLLEEISRADPGNAVFRSSLARTLRQKGELGKAVELYRQAVATTPDDPEAWYNLAVALQEMGKVRESTEAVTEAIRRDPSRPEAHNALGVAETMAGRLEEAMVEFRKVIELDPRNATAYNNVGNVLRAENRVEEAAGAYRKASELAPRYADPLNGLGTLEVQRDRPQAAIPYFDRALLLEPRDHEILLNRAIALEQMGDRAGAIEGYRQFLSAVGDESEFASQRAAARQLLARLGASAR